MLGVLYSCPLCGIVDQVVNTPFRKPDEPVKKWMDGLIITLGNDHRRRSPRCHPKELKNVKIPMPAGTKFIGGPVEQ